MFNHVRHAAAITECPVKSNPEMSRDERPWEERWGDSLRLGGEVDPLSLRYNGPP